ncbi:MAG: hypothetical protein OEM94_06755 [Acidimicrobiia bacterium]|nr:hypothetical protein [Acidimicrobiia bacterium]
MSVDTYLKGKKMDNRYRRHQLDGVEILVANTLSSWAESVVVDVKRFLLWRRLKPMVLHKHRPT